MTQLARTERRVRLLTACRDGAAVWAPHRSRPPIGESPWVLNGERLAVTHPDAEVLDELEQRSLTHECDSQEITPDGEALLREWSR